MANSTVSLGANVINPQSGSEATPLREAVVASGNSAIGKNSFIIRKNDGTVDIAGATVGIFGIAQAMTDANGEPVSYVPATSGGGYKVLYVPATAETQIIIKANSTVAESNFGECADITAASVSSTTGFDGVKIDTNSGMAASSAQLQIIGFANTIDNDTSATGVDLICKIYEVQATV